MNKKQNLRELSPAEISLVTGAVASSYADIVAIDDYRRATSTLNAFTPRHLYMLRLRALEAGYRDA